MNTTKDQIQQLTPEQQDAFGATRSITGWIMAATIHSCFQPELRAETCDSDQRTAKRIMKANGEILLTTDEHRLNTNEN